MDSAVPVTVLGYTVHKKTGAIFGLVKRLDIVPDKIWLTKCTSADLQFKEWNLIDPIQYVDAQLDNNLTISMHVDDKYLYLFDREKLRLFMLDWTGNTSAIETSDLPASALAGSLINESQGIYIYPVSNQPSIIYVAAKKTILISKNKDRKDWTPWAKGLDSDPLIIAANKNIMVVVPNLTGHIYIAKIGDPNFKKYEIKAEMNDVANGVFLSDNYNSFTLVLKDGTILSYQYLMNATDDSIDLILKDKTAPAHLGFDGASPFIAHLADSLEQDTIYTVAGVSNKAHPNLAFGSVNIAASKGGEISDLIKQTFTDQANTDVTPVEKFMILDANHYFYLSTSGQMYIGTALGIAWEPLDVTVKIG